MNTDSSADHDLLTRTIASQALFTGLAPASLARLVSAARMMRHAAGDILIRENSVNDRLFLIVDGEARVDSNGTMIGRLAAGDLAGEISSAGISPPVATVQADSELQTLSFPALLIAEIAGHDAVFARRLRQAAFQRISG